MSTPVLYVTIQRKLLICYNIISDQVGYNELLGDQFN